MKLLILTSSLVLGCLSLNSQADYLVKIPLTEKYGLAINQSWVAADPLVSNWLNYNKPYNCTSWTPDASTIDEGVSFIQTEANCKQDQKRTVTSRETNKATGEIRTVDTVTETQTILGVTGSLTQKSIGTRSITGCYYSFGEGVIKSYVEHRMEKSPKTNKYKSFYYNDKFFGRLDNDPSTGISSRGYFYYMGNLKKTINLEYEIYDYYEICIRKIQY